MTFTATNQWRKKTYFFFFELFENIFHYFFFAPFHHFLTGIVTIGLSDPCKKQTQKVIHFGDCSNRRAWVLIRSLLFNRNNWGQTRDLIYVGSFHLTHELPGVRTESFHVPPLPFSINCVKSQR